VIICEVIGHVWATKKMSEFEGLKLMIVRETETNAKGGSVFVAADRVGAGIGERVLVVSGSTARVAVGGNDLPVDCAIVGIIDSLEVDRERGSAPTKKQAKSGGTK
jgi:ethanolamine utilization protein EutN